MDAHAIPPAPARAADAASVRGERVPQARVTPRSYQASALRRSLLRWFRCHPPRCRPPLRRLRLPPLPPRRAPAPSSSVAPSADCCAPRASSRRARRADARPVGRLRAFRHPGLRLLRIEHEAVGGIPSLQRIERAETLDEAAVARHARVGDDDAVEWTLFGAAAGESDFEGHWFVSFQSIVSECGSRQSALDWLLRLPSAYFFSPNGLMPPSPGSLPPPSPGRSGIPAGIFGRLNAPGGGAAGNPPGILPGIFPICFCSASISSGVGCGNPAILPPMPPPPSPNICAILPIA